MEKRSLLDTIKKKINTAVEMNFDISYRILKQLGINLYENQIEIVQNVIDLTVDKLFIAQARAAGKTFAVELGALYVCLNNPGFRMGVVGPKLDQATRFLKELQKTVKGTTLEDEIVWNKTAASRITFRNGSTIVGLSGSKTAEVEGHHFDMVIIDESHRVSSFSFQNKIVPMLGGSQYSNIVKMGVTMYKNHFRTSGKPGSAYTKLIRDWAQCPYLLRGGSIMYKGKEYSQFVVDRMPLALKKEFFPDRPDLHYEGDMTMIDFLTQYMMEWADQLNTFLNEKQQDLLIGDHLVKEEAEYGHKYFYGLDTQKGSLDGENLDKRDYTALSIWEKSNDNTKRKVASFQWQEDPLEQMDEIQFIITKLFPCEFGLIEYSNNGVMMLETFKRDNIAGDGVIPNKKEKQTGLNYQNAMYTHFKYELNHERVQYPKKEEIQKDIVMTEHYNQWCMLEKITTTGLNDKIRAPEGEHDDGTDADAMAVFAADKADVFSEGRKRTRRIPKPVSGVKSLSGPSGKEMNNRPWDKSKTGGW